MTRMSKQGERRNVSYKRPKVGGKKTGPKKDNLKMGFKDQVNSLKDAIATQAYIGKVKSI